MENNNIDTATYNKVINKLVNLEDKFSEIDTITKMLNIWVKENSYELIPIINILNSKIKDMADIINK